MADLFCFDLDGTITSTELLPLIASEVGLMHEFNVLTQLTMDGKIHFEDSMRLRCAILRNIPISTVQNIVLTVPLFEGLVDFIREHKESCYVVTGNLDIWVKPLIEQIGCGFYASSTVTEKDTLLNLDYIMHKSDAIKELRHKHPNSRIVAVGDGFNDIPMFEASDVTIATGLVHEPNFDLVKISDFLVYKEESLCRTLNML